MNQPHNSKGSIEARGFTIVELLIVIVVIAILAAISIVAYNGIQERARVTVVKSDLSTIAKKMGLYQAEHAEYPDTNVELASSGLQVSTKDDANAAIYCGNSSGYAVIMRDSKTAAARQFRIGSGEVLTEVNPRLSWSGAALCSSTPYPGVGWNGIW